MFPIYLFTREGQKGWQRLLNAESGHTTMFTNCLIASSGPYPPHGLGVVTGQFYVRKTFWLCIGGVDASFLYIRVFCFIIIVPRSTCLGIHTVVWWCCGSWSKRVCLFCAYNSCILVCATWTSINWPFLDRHRDYTWMNPFFTAKCVGAGVDCNLGDKISLHFVWNGMILRARYRSPILIIRSSCFELSLPIVSRIDSKADF